MSLRDHEPALVASHRGSQPLLLDRKLAVLARSEWGVPYISYYENLCSHTCALYAAAGVPLLFDADHYFNTSPA